MYFFALPFNCLEEYLLVSANVTVSTGMLIWISEDSSTILQNTGTLNNNFSNLVHEQAPGSRFLLLGYFGKNLIWKTVDVEEKGHFLCEFFHGKHN